MEFCGSATLTRCHKKLNKHKSNKQPANLNQTVQRPAENTVTHTSAGSPGIFTNRKGQEL